MSHDDKKLRLALFTALHQVYADTALALVPAEEYMQMAGNYGYHG